jgi:hypothetical protein
MKNDWLKVCCIKSQAPKNKYQTISKSQTPMLKTIEESRDLFGGERKSDFLHGHQFGIWDLFSEIYL